MEEGLSKLVDRYFPGGEDPFTIQWPPPHSLPEVTCIGNFRSEPLESIECNVFSYSCLVVYWFVHRAERGVPNIVIDGLATLDWEGNARDYSVER